MTKLNKERCLLPKNLAPPKAENEKVFVDVIRGAIQSTNSKDYLATRRLNRYEIEGSLQQILDVDMNLSRFLPIDSQERVSRKQLQNYSFQRNGCKPIFIY